MRQDYSYFYTSVEEVLAGVGPAGQDGGGSMEDWSESRKERAIRRLEQRRRWMRRLTRRARQYYPHPDFLFSNMRTYTRSVVATFSCAIGRVSRAAALAAATRVGITGR